MGAFLAFRGIEATSPEFQSGLVAVSRRLGTDPNWIAAVMARESGFNPAALNPSSNAAGLIQFMPSTAHLLGTTTAELLAMTREAQLPFVEAFYRHFAGKMHSAGDVYMATFMPAFMGRPAGTPLFVAGSLGYRQNAALDRNRDGVITVGDVESLINQTIAEARGHSPAPASRSHGGGALEFLLMMLVGSVVTYGIRKKIGR